MEPRIEFTNAAPGAYKAMAGLEAYLYQCGLEPSLRELGPVHTNVLEIEEQLCLHEA